jgi:hypothetical protein
LQELETDEQIDAKVPKIFCVILCTYERTGWICPELMEFVSQIPFNQNYATIVRKAHNFLPAAAARNFIAKQLLLMKPEPTWVLMLDNDMAPPLNLLDTIKNAPDDAMIVCPMFHLWTPEERTTKLCWGMDNIEEKTYPNGRKGLKIEKDKYYDITKCGTGAIFIRPELFRRIPSPWFEYKYDDLGNLTATEDIIFCDKVRAAGMRMVGYSGITVGHNHTVDLALLHSILHTIKEPETVEDSTEKQVAAD